MIRCGWTGLMGDIKENGEREVIGYRLAELLIEDVIKKVTIHA